MIEKDELENKMKESKRWLFKSIGVKLNVLKIKKKKKIEGEIKMKSKVVVWIYKIVFKSGAVNCAGAGAAAGVAAHATHAPANEQWERGIRHKQQSFWIE